MSAELTEQESVVNTIPEPEIVRGQLSHALREAQLLRQLLRLAERAAKEKNRRKEADENSTSRSTGPSNIVEGGSSKRER